MLPSNRYPSGISRRIGLLALSSAFVALLGVYSGCNTGPKGPLSVPLEYRPAHAEPITGSLPATDVKVHIAPIEDKRVNKDEIGKNVEDDVPVPIFSADKSPMEFVRDVMAQEVQNFGVSLSDVPEAADRIIAVNLSKFFVEESNNYRAEVTGIAEVRDKGGNVFWKGPIGGQGTTFGRSLSAENYNEVLSDATRRAVGSLLTNPKFADALVK